MNILIFLKCSSLEAAIDGYAESGSLDTAAMTVEKAAKVISEMEPEKAIKVSALFILRRLYLDLKRMSVVWSRVFIDAKICP